jgi:hypothetical protein
MNEETYFDSAQGIDISQDRALARISKARTLLQVKKLLNSLKTWVTRKVTQPKKFLSG